MRKLLYSPKLTIIMKMAKILPKVFYGLHFVDGTAEYREPGQKSYRIFLNEQTLRDMDPTFEGCPVYVLHKDDVDVTKIQEEADGYVINSFYNEADGKHWCKFIVVSDKGHDAIRQGWTLSNAYVPESFAPGGLWNGIEYTKQITKAKFEHLAIVPDPRYAESKVLTPQEFKSYNESQISALKKVANSDKGKKSNMAKLFQFFKKSEVEQDFENTIVKLSNGKEMTIAECLTIANASFQEKDEDKKAVEAKKENEAVSSMKPKPEADPREAMDKHEEHKATEDKHGDKKSGEEEEKQGHKEEEKGAPPQMANMDHHVQVGNKSMSIRDMYNEHARMSKHFQDFSHFLKSYSNDEQMDGGEKDAKAAQKADLTKTNADLDGGEKEAESQEKVADKTKRNAKSEDKGFFDALSSAPTRMQMAPKTNLGQVERGKARYGSN